MKNTVFLFLLFSAFILISCSQKKEGNNFIKEYTDVINTWEAKIKDTLTAEDSKKIRELLEEYKLKGSDLKAANKLTEQEKEEFNKLHLRFVKSYMKAEIKKDSLINLKGNQ